MSVLKKALNQINLAFNGKEVRSIVECIIDDALVLPDVAKVFKVVQGITMKTQIGYFERLYKISQKSQACGTLTPTSQKVKTREKFWLPTEIEILVQQCYKDLEETFFEWSDLARAGVAKANLTVGDAYDFIIETLQVGSAHDMQRIAWFADKNIDDVGSGGTLKLAADIPNYDQIDGLFKQWFAIATANTKQRVTIAANAGANYVAQDTLATDLAKNIMKEMILKADARIFGKSQKPHFLLTSSLYRNYQAWRSEQPVSESFIELTDGRKVLAYQGYEVVEYNMWDDVIRADFDNGTKWHLPHRALFTTQENTQLGVDSMAALGEFEAEYLVSTKLNTIRGAYDLDAKVALDYLGVIAY
jgi:hypothetical protein